MYILISYILQCMYSPLSLIIMYTILMGVLGGIFAWMHRKEAIIDRTRHCLPCGKLFPETWTHCDVCHKCTPPHSVHVRLFRRCFDRDLYLVYTTIQNTTLFIFCIYNLVTFRFPKVAIDAILIFVSLL